LRREVRVAGCLLLILAPLISACTLGWSSGPVRVLACSITDTPARAHDVAEGVIATGQVGRLDLARRGTPGVDVLSVEPAALASGTETDVPVNFPGYVLPDDSREEPTHEGS
jgi:hypothetical protein